jgi:diguanylate cyclase (GGDEF)-like protein
MTEVTELEKLTAQVRYWEERATKTELRLQQTIERGRAHLESLSNQLAQAESRCNILQAELEKQPKVLESKPVQSNELEEKLKAAEERARVFEGELRDIHYKVADRFLKGASHDWFSPLNVELKETPPPGRVEELLDQHYRLLAFGEAQRQHSNRLEQSSTELSLELLDLRRQLAQRSAMLESARHSTPEQNNDPELQRIAFEDPLTGLPNRALAGKYLEQQLELLEKNTSTLALVIIDLDRLRNTNLTLGMEVGDALIQSFAERLKSQLQPNDVLTRGRDDEFLIILVVPEGGGDGINAARQAIEATASRIFESLQLPIEACGHRLLVSAGVGAVVCQQKESLRIVTERAQLALSYAKADGRNQIQLHTSILEETGRQRLLLVPQLQKAIDENQFSLQFQPVVELKSQKVWGVEALLRWKHPEDGIIPMRQFLEVALESGLIVQIGDWVVREASKIASQLNHHHLSINLSAHELMQADFIRKFTKSLELAHVTRPDRLVVEVSEKDLLNESERLSGALSELRRWKINLAVDNFGFDSLPLKRVQAAGIHFIKLDQQLIKESDQPINQALISAAVQLGGTIGCQTWAEGVETHEQLKRIKDLGVHLAQGRALYSPMSAHDLRDKLH